MVMTCHVSPGGRPPNCNSDQSVRDSFAFRTLERDCLKFIACCADSDAYPTSAPTSITCAATPHVPVRFACLETAAGAAAGRLMLCTLKPQVFLSLQTCHSGPTCPCTLLSMLLRKHHIMWLGKQCGRNTDQTGLKGALAVGVRLCPMNNYPPKSHTTIEANASAWVLPEELQDCALQRILG